MSDKTETLARLPIFAGLELRSLEAVGSLAHLVHAPAGTALAREGEAAESLFIIISGTVHISRGGQLVRAMVDGGFLGEIALLEGGERTATATCATDCELVELGRYEFGRVIARLPDVRARVEAAAARRPHAGDRSPP